jgi:hypothetical protein
MLGFAPLGGSDPTSVSVCQHLSHSGASDSRSLSDPVMAGQPCMFFNPVSDDHNRRTRRCKRNDLWLSMMLRTSRMGAKQFWQAGSLARSSSAIASCRLVSVSRIIGADRSDSSPDVYPLKYGATRRRNKRLAAARPRGFLLIVIRRSAARNSCGRKRCRGRESPGSSSPMLRPRVRPLQSQPYLRGIWARRY